MAIRKDTARVLQSGPQPLPCNTLVVYRKFPVRSELFHRDSHLADSLHSNCGIVSMGGHETVGYGGSEVNRSTRYLLLVGATAVRSVPAGTSMSMTYVE